MDAKLSICWKVKVQFKDMDMSGGDNVDGPRWTGRYLDRDTTLAIVAPTEELASAAALSLCYEHQAAKVASVLKVSDVHAVVHLTLPASH
jgi:hypothetical protein